MDGRFMGPGWHGGFGFGLLGILFFAMFIGLLIWALLRLMGHDHRVHHALTPPMGAPMGGAWQPRDEALVAARLRYARGELDRDQYFRMVEDLTGVPRPPDAAPPPPFPPAPEPTAPDPE